MSDPRGDADELRAYGFLLDDGSPTIMWTVAGTDAFVLEPSRTDALSRLRGLVETSGSRDADALRPDDIEPVPAQRVHMWNVCVDRRNGSPAEWASYLATSAAADEAASAEFERAESVGDFPDIGGVERELADAEFGRSEHNERRPGLTAEHATWLALYAGAVSDLDRGWRAHDIVSVTAAGAPVTVAADQDARAARALARASRTGAHCEGSGPEPAEPSGRRAAALHRRAPER